MSQQETMNKNLQGKPLQGKVALVIGAGQAEGQTLGNGRAVAMEFARQGAIVVAVDRDAASGEETARLCRENGGQARYSFADVTDEDSLKAMVVECMLLHHRIDILHNNVGVAGSAGDQPVERIEIDKFDQIYAINLRGMALTCKHVLPIMREQRSGSVINVSSTAALGMYPNVAYKVTKAGVLGLTHHIAVAYAQYGVRCNSILPGLLDTPMAIETRMRLTGKSRSDILLERAAMVPLKGHAGTAQDVANAAAFLASDLAAFITGVDLPVDGGALAWINSN